MPSNIFFINKQKFNSNKLTMIKKKSYLFHLILEKLYHQIFKNFRQ